MSNNTRRKIGFLYKLGEILQDHFPNLGNGYNGNLFQVAQNIQKRFPDKFVMNYDGRPMTYADIPLSFLKTGVRYCLAGFEENDFHKGYSGIDEEGFEMKKGNGGIVARDKGVGLFSIPLEIKRELGKKNVYKLHAINGNVSWQPWERISFFKYFKNPDFEYRSRPNYGLIAEKLNDEFHNGAQVRNKKSLEIELQRIKNRLGIEKKTLTDWNEIITYSSLGQQMPLIDFVIYLSEREKFQLKYRDETRIKTKAIAEYLNNKFPEKNFNSDNVGKTLRRYTQDQESVHQQRTA